MTIQRYTCVLNEGTDREMPIFEKPDDGGSYVRYADHQAELAALREELATAKRSEHNSEVAYKAAIERQEELRSDLVRMTEGRDGLRSTLNEANKVIAWQRDEKPDLAMLTAAEQRNAKLERVLTQLLNEDDGLLAVAELSTGFVWCALQRHAGSIDAALKPIESGASE